MAKKKKKKSSSSKAQYDAKKKNTAAAQKSPAKSEEKDKAAVPAVDPTVTEAAAEAETAAVEAFEAVSENTEASKAKEEDTKNTYIESESPSAPSPVEYAPLIAAPDVEIPYDPDLSAEELCRSIKKLKPKDIIMPEETEKKVKRKNKANAITNIIQIFLLVVCAGVAAVCIYMLSENIWGKVKGQEIYSKTEFEIFTLEDLNQSTPSGALSHITKDVPLLTVFERIETGKSNQIEQVVPEQYNEQLAQMKASLSALKEQNSDVYGWIYVEGTNINHPVVRCDDNSYYLNHAYTGEYLPIGSIFADLTTKDLITDNYNTVLYGHNVVSTGQSSMFHDVEKFLDREFFDTTNIYVYTMDGAFVYRPVAIYDTVSDYFYFQTVFNTEDDFLSFAKEMVDNSKFASGAIFAPGDRMLTLSTCTNGAQNGRYSLHAKLVEVIK